MLRLGQCPAVLGGGPSQLPLSIELSPRFGKLLLSLLQQPAVLCRLIRKLLRCMVLLLQLCTLGNLYFHLAFSVTDAALQVGLASFELALYHSVCFTPLPLFVCSENRLRR